MEENENIEILRGDPKKALIKIAIPMVFALLLISFNNIIDRIWVAGLGTDVLAAIGFVSPLFMIIIGMGNGLGAGSNSSISRFIGSKQKDDAGNSALHSLLIVMVVSILIPLFVLPFFDDIVVYMGAGSVMNYVRDYGIPILLGSFAFLFNLLFSSQLRAEGDMKKATFVMAAVEVLNMILDPIFIYVFDLGIKGAALATVVASIIPTLVAVYWLFIKKNTYINYNVRNFKYHSSYIRDILTVGIPASLEEFIISMVNIILNSMLVIVSGTSIIAAFNISFIILQLGMMPCIAIGTSAITVAGVAYGAKEYDKVKTTCHYGIKISLMIATIITVLIVLFAPQLAMLFTYNQANNGLYNLIIDVLRIVSVFLVVTPVGGICAMVFQGMGKGTISLLLTVVRELVFVVLLSYLFGILLNFGVNGILNGFVMGLIIGSAISLIVFELFIKKVKNANTT
ncbi:MATE family efflux transporter [Methanosphaera sp. BMS]|uniref:MATE family efflux transporter n=1 Tax=Methanosphaera sp. BMS TaxID=1789762 RepID=UPI000DC1DAEC|nr:MATE family efflux transporter [Methanosphaera sp. BMS]AWX31984.1 MATE family efflux transporter [Methanosphaera sp. BMS]